MFREGNSPLMKMGLIITALALALVIAAVVVRVILGSEPELVVAAEVATKSVGEASRYSSGEEGSATKKSGSGEAHGDVADLHPYPTFEKRLIVRADRV